MNIEPDSVGNEILEATLVGVLSIEVDEARRMLENSDLNIITAMDLNDAAKRIVAAVKS